MDFKQLCIDLCCKLSTMPKSYSCFHYNVRNKAYRHSQLYKIFFPFHVKIRLLFVMQYMIIILYVEEEIRKLEIWLTVKHCPLTFRYYWYSHLLSKSVPWVNEKGFYLLLYSIVLKTFSPSRLCLSAFIFVANHVLKSLFPAIYDLMVTLTS